mgnify:CR=1 FL=1
MAPASRDDVSIAPFDIEGIFPDAGRPAVGVDAVRLPRRQEGSAQELAITLVADYTLLRRSWLPSAALVALLTELGVSTAAARTVISRLSRRGLLDGSRDGRRTLYRLPGPVAAHLAHAGRWIAAFAAGPDPWDGTWTLLAFSLPKEETRQRRRLRGQLRWLGFAPLFDGLWVSPRHLDADGEERLRAVAGGATALFRARHLGRDWPTDREPLAAWDLGLIAQSYADFLGIWTPVSDRVRRGEVGGIDAVRFRTEVMDTYRLLPVLDPRLPAELLPSDWPRHRAREVFVAVYDGLARAAETHVRAVATAWGADLPGLRAHTVEQMAAGLGYE